MSEKKKIIYSLAFGNFVASISALIVAGVLSEMSNDLKINVESIGQLIMIFALTYALCAPIISAISGHIDRRNLLIFGMFAVLLGNSIIAFSLDYPLIVFGRIISAIGSAIFTPLTVLVGVSIAGVEEKGKVSSIIFTGSAVATAFGVPFGTYIGITFGWRYSFWIVSVLALLSVIMIYRVMPRKILRPIANFKTLGDVFKAKALRAFLGITILQFGGQIVLFAFISPWLKYFTDLKATGINIILVLIGIGGIVGNIITGKMTDNCGPRKVQLFLIIGLIVVMPSLVIIQHNLYIGGFLFFIWGLIGQGFVSPQLVRIVNINPELASASLSLNSSFINIGIFFGALLASVFIDMLGLEYLTVIGLLVIIMAMVVFLLSWKLDSKSYQKITV